MKSFFSVLRGCCRCALHSSTLLMPLFDLTTFFFFILSGVKVGGAKFKPTAQRCLLSSSSLSFSTRPIKLHLLTPEVTAASKFGSGNTLTKWSAASCCFTATRWQYASVKTPRMDGSISTWCVCQMYMAVKFPTMGKREMLLLLLLLLHAAALGPL
jgi:hypothetical protein